MQFGLSIGLYVKAILKGLWNYTFKVINLNVNFSSIINNGFLNVLCIALALTSHKINFHMNPMLIPLHCLLLTTCGLKFHLYNSIKITRYEM